MPARFGVERDVTRTCIGKVGDDPVDGLNHQVHVNGRLDAVLDECAADQRADCQVGNKVIVHDIEVNDVGAGCECGAYVLAQSSEVGGENRRCD